jgi:phosphonatase-like hydrolase
MHIQLVIFDMAGTTVRDDDSVNTCLRQALAASQLEVSRDEVNTVMGMPKPMAIRLLVERKQPSGQAGAPALVTAIYDDFLRRMICFYRTAPQVEPMPDAYPVLCRLKQAGLRLALDTGFSRPIVNVILERLGWSHGLLLDATVASDEVTRGRPHPDLIFKAMQLTDVTDPRAVAKVGDTPSDLQEGTAAGCGLVIGVTNGTHTQEQLKAHPHTHLIASLAALPPLVEAAH